MISSPDANGAYPLLTTGTIFGIIAREGDLGTFAEGLAVYRSVQNPAEAWGDCVNS